MKIISNTVETKKYFSAAFSSLMVGIGIVTLIFGVYGITDFVTGFLQHTFNLHLQETVAAAQAFELVGRAAVSIAVIWRLSTAITALPHINFTAIRELFAERGALLALVIASIMTASMQHRLYWWLSDVIDPSGAFNNKNLEAATNANMVGSLSLIMVFILFYDKGASIIKPLSVSLSALLLGVVIYWYTIGVI